MDGTHSFGELTMLLIIEFGRLHLASFVAKFFRSLVILDTYSQETNASEDCCQENKHRDEDLVKDQTPKIHLHT